MCFLCFAGRYTDRAPFSSDLITRICPHGGYISLITQHAPETLLWVYDQFHSGWTYKQYSRSTIPTSKDMAIWTL